MELPGPLRTLFTPTSAAISSALFVATWLLHRWLLPEPIAGIPYNKSATKSIFGDIPSMLNHLKTSHELGNWLLAHIERHNSPIVQIFADLFGKPMVLISDYRETQVWFDGITFRSR
jgi:hypothetical protein